MYTYTNRCFHVYVEDVHDFFNKMAPKLPPFQGINTLSAKPSGFEIIITLQDVCSDSEAQHFANVLSSYFAGEII